MGNCLVTKLKSIVDNDSLLKIGEFKFHVSSTEGGSFKIQGVSKAHVVGTGLIGSVSADATEIVFVDKWAQNTVVFSSGEYDIVFNDKYSFQGLIDATKGFCLDFDDIFKFSNPVGVFNFMASSLLYSDIDVTLVDRSASFSLINDDGLTQYSANIEGIGGSTTIGTIRLYNTKNVIGNILNLANVKTLVELRVDNTSVEGEINTFAQSMMSNGRTSGDLYIRCENSRITDGGNVVTPEYLESVGGTIWIVLHFSNGTYTKTYA